MRKGTSKYDWEFARILYKARFNDQQVRQILQVKSKGTCCDWRHKNNLKSHQQSGRTEFVEIEKRAYTLRKFGKNDEQIITLLRERYSIYSCIRHLTIYGVNTLIGHHLMRLCRTDDSCPTKALLPEYEMKERVVGGESSSSS
jgi:hypothetical protein